MSAVVEEEGSWITHRLLTYGLLAIVTALWGYHRKFQQTRLYKMGNKLPGPFALPIFGNGLIALFVKLEDAILVGFKFAEKYGFVVRGWLGTKLGVFLANPEDIEVILNSNVHIDKSSDYRFFEPWLGEGLLISSGSKWRSHRKIIAPTFHINILKSFIDVFNQNSKETVENLKSQVGKTFNIHDRMGEVTVNILLETAMGITRKTQDQSSSDYALAVMKMCDIIHQRHFKFWLRSDFLFKLFPFYKMQQKLLGIIHGLTNKVIKIKKETYNENKSKGIIPPTLEELTKEPSDEDDKGRVNSNESKTISDNVFKAYRDDLDFNDENDVGEKKRLAFLDLLIESTQNGTNQLTDREIKEEVDTIMFEGHDTTAAASSFVLSLLGIYQDIQDKVYDELYNIFGDSDRPATHADTLQMKYLERVILETLRLYPPVPLIARELKHDVKIVTNNYVLPAGTTVIICTYGIHRHPKHYKDPNTFNPDNFLPENTQNRHYYSYIPFSAGPRSCVGRKYALLKLKILLSTILRNYRCISHVPTSEFKLTVDIILKTSNGFNIQIEPRKRVPSNL